MASQNTSVINQVLNVSNPATVQQSDSSTAMGLAGRNGDMLVSDTHGQFYNAAARGNVFFVHSPLAGTVPVLSAATIVSPFAVWNPAGSGKNVELLDFSWQQYGTGTEIVDGLGIAFQTNVSTLGAPGTLTAGVINNGLVGKGLTSVCAFYTAATLTNAAIGASFPHYWLFSTQLATTATQIPGQYKFDGKLIMPPDTILTPVTATTGTHIKAWLSLSWAEWPV